MESVEKVFVQISAKEMDSESCKKRPVKVKKNKQGCKHKQTWEKDYPFIC